jgi:hypothetical protein
MSISLDLINGLVFGIEHMNTDDEDSNWMVVIHIAIFRFYLINWKPEA